MEAAGTYETTLNFCHTTRRKNSDDSHVHSLYLDYHTEFNQTELNTLTDKELPPD
jgi:hypothetical protein